jgi:hypothetical protein
VVQEPEPGAELGPESVPTKSLQQKQAPGLHLLRGMRRAC